jgi:hypothetical protein
LSREEKDCPAVNLPDEAVKNLFVRIEEKAGSEGQ